ncbi:hypothetical protein RHS04_00116 [Rhizoctonia solani]|uniref:Uncharacterized protein n=1 Tax=Rhizoctonia solani TaxID=456999 RepID=A0A8H7HH53_9AGAM|nr:hypothetical protein RHS04_00116 [Rhizoctonia solani]
MISDYRVHSLIVQELRPDIFQPPALFRSFAMREDKDSVLEVRYTGSKSMHIRVAGLREWSAAVPGAYRTAQNHAF